MTNRVAILQGMCNIMNGYTVATQFTILLQLLTTQSL